ncbi:MAG: hypothetical protein AAF623_14615 [Planctomycetota bacterium]
MFWEIYQQREIDSAKRTANRAELKAAQQQDYIRRLEDKIDSLALACQSMWELLRDNSRLTEKELAAKMEEVDLRDGSKDGKITASVGACPSCGRQTTRKRKRCIYCGETLDRNQAFGSN